MLTINIMKDVMIWARKM